MQQHALGEEADVAAALGEVLVVGALERLADLGGDAVDRPLGADALVADQRLDPLAQVGVAQHHLLRLEDLAVLAVGQAVLDGLELGVGAAQAQTEARELLVGLGRLDLAAGHVEVTAIDDVRATDTDAGAGGDARQLATRTLARRRRPAAGLGRAARPHAVLVAVAHVSPNPCPTSCASAS
ncbi:MAG: hypothetical protein U0168_05560 [Nannocystaceae bacterium]